MLLFLTILELLQYHLRLGSWLTLLNKRQTIIPSSFSFGPGGLALLLLRLYGHREQLCKTIPPEPKPGPPGPDLTDSTGLGVRRPSAFLCGKSVTGYGTFRSYFWQAGGDRTAIPVTSSRHRRKRG